MAGRQLRGFAPYVGARCLELARARKKVMWKMLTNEERRRLQKYHDLIAGLGGRVDVLTREEQRDMKEMLKREMIEQGVYTPEEAKEL